MKSFLRSIIPTPVFLWYHRLKALAAALRYGFPSRRMVVIGVTGTKGKTTTANFIWAVLEAGGKRTGLVSTALIRIGDRQMLNPFHMTMLAPFMLQKFLRTMADEGCTHCVIETSSEGLAQWRHAGIWYDVAVFTNLSPEHIDSHGSFEAYRAAKGRLFAALMHHPRKTIGGEPVERITLINNDAAHREFFLAFPADRVVTFGLTKGADYVADDITAGAEGARFRVGSHHYELAILGGFNVLNALAAVAAGEIMGVSPENVARGLYSLKSVPGRMEIIDEQQPFRVVVDYAHEKVSMGALLAAARGLVGKKKKIIVLLGAEGGGRDKTKRPAMGELAGRLADYTVVSNVDPYDDDPREILEDIARAAEAAGSVREKNLFVIEDRRAGIRKSLSLAGKGDAVLITGKGAEQSMIIKGARILWDDRLVAREELQALRSGNR